MSMLSIVETADSAPNIEKKTPQSKEEIPKRHVLGSKQGPSSPTSVSDSLDAQYDGVTLRRLLLCDEEFRQRDGAIRTVRWFTPDQRKAISDLWSARLRKKVADAAEADRLQVLVEEQ